MPADASFYEEKEGCVELRSALLRGALQLLGLQTREDIQRRIAQRPRGGGQGAEYDAAAGTAAGYVAAYDAVGAGGGGARPRAVDEAALTLVTASLAATPEATAPPRTPPR